MALQGLDDYQAAGGTALNDAVYKALTRLGPVDRRRAIVLLTDGRDENNERARDLVVSTRSNRCSRRSAMSMRRFTVSVSVRELIARCCSQSWLIRLGRGSYSSRKRPTA